MVHCRLPAGDTQGQQVDLVVIGPGKKDAKHDGVCPPYVGARCNSVVRAFAHGAMGVGSILHGGPNELFLVPGSATRLV